MAKVKGEPHTRRRTYIRAWRKFRGLSQQRLADSLGVTVGAISQLENGLISYTQGTLEGIALALDCQPHELLIRDPEGPPDIFSIYDALPPAQKNQAVEILKALRRTA